MENRGITGELEALFLPQFEQLRRELSAEYPAYSFRVWSSATGSLTSYQGYDLGLECTFPDADDQEANCVAASVGVRYLTTAPEICDFGIDWAAGASPGVSEELLPEAIPFSAEKAQDLAASFPNLASRFRKAVAAWAPWQARA